MTTPRAAAATPFTRETRLARLPVLLRERILVLDGAMGTLLQRHAFSEADFRGQRFADHPTATSAATTTSCASPSPTPCARSIAPTSPRAPTS